MLVTDGVPHGGTGKVVVWRLKDTPALKLCSELRFVSPSRRLSSHNFAAPGCHSPAPYHGPNVLVITPAHCRAPDTACPEICGVKTQLPIRKKKGKAYHLTLPVKATRSEVVKTPLWHSGQRATSSEEKLSCTTVQGLGHYFIWPKDTSSEYHRWACQDVRGTKLFLKMPDFSP